MSAAYAEGLKLSSAGTACGSHRPVRNSPGRRSARCQGAVRAGQYRPAAGPGRCRGAILPQVLALEPARLEALVNLANLLRAQGQFDAAIALAGAGTGARSAGPELHLTLGSAWREKGEGQRRSTLPRRAGDQSPLRAALANLADMLCDDGDFAQARTLYDAAIKADPQGGAGAAEPGGAASSERRSERRLARLCRPHRGAGQGAGHARRTAFGALDRRSA